jgi:hypothetical protein
VIGTESGEVGRRRGLRKEVFERERPGEGHSLSPFGMHCVLPFVAMCIIAVCKMIDGGAKFRTRAQTLVGQNL